jgi:Flp pilus assembly pilin Flp
MADILEALRRRGRSDTGPTIAEYSVVLSVITIACIGAIALLGGNIIAAIGRVAGLIP